MANIIPNPWQRNATWVEYFPGDILLLSEMVQTTQECDLKLENIAQKKFLLQELFSWSGARKGGFFSFFAASDRLADILFPLHVDLGLWRVYKVVFVMASRVH